MQPGSAAGVCCKVKLAVWGRPALGFTDLVSDYLGSWFLPRSSFNGGLIPLATNPTAIALLPAAVPCWLLYRILLAARQLQGSLATYGDSGHC